jgi:hypothetical protein
MCAVLAPDRPEHLRHFGRHSAKAKIKESLTGKTIAGKVLAHTKVCSLCAEADLITGTIRFLNDI